MKNKKPTQIKWISLKNDTPKENIPLIVTDFEDYCCVEYIKPNTYPTQDNCWRTMGCMSTYMYSDVEISFEPTHYAEL